MQHVQDCVSNAMPNFVGDERRPLQLVITLIHMSAMKKISSLRTMYANKQERLEVKFLGT